jgi:hypothetical protein
MQPPNARILPAITLLISASLACSLFSSGSKPTPTIQSAEPAVASFPTEAPTEAAPTDAQVMDTAEPTAAVKPTEPVALALATLPPAIPGPETLDLSNLPAPFELSDFHQDLQSDMSWTDPDGSAVETSTAYNYQQQSQPAAWSLLFDDNNPFIASTIETTLIDQQGYSASTETGCRLVPVDSFQDQQPRKPFQDLLAGLTGTASRTEAGATLDDLLVDVYTLDETNLKPGAEIEIKASEADSEGSFTSSTSTTLKLMEENTNLDSGKLYLAQQGGFVTRIELAYSKTADENDLPFAQPGTLMQRTLVYELVPSKAGDEPVEMPADCEGSAPPSSPTETSGGGSQGAITTADLPRLPDASGVVEAAGTLLYTTQSSFSEVMDFYSQGMSDLGFESTSSVTLGNMGSLEYSRGDQTVSITVLESDNGVMVTIAID